jgi:stage V sporulation protein R
MLKIDSRMDWTEDLLIEAWDEIAKISVEELELVPGKDLYPNQFEIVTAEQMLDAYASVGLPVHYYHWSFGKEFVKNEQQYAKGRMGLAYEMVINTNPCVNLLMEENLAYMQVMVMAHAGVGHNAVFANNEYFKEWTNAGSIIEYMVFARNYIALCEDRYGAPEVERVLDACHALANHGIDKYKRKHQPKLDDEQRLKKLFEKDEARQRELDIVMKRTSIVENDELKEEATPTLDEENLLYFIMKRAPKLEQWKREIIRIVYKINQYFSPQGLTKTLNEGFATFCHYYIMQRLEEKGIITSDAFIAFLKSHSSVVYQPPYNSRHWSGLNPYALGYAIFRDIKRICENPTDEDKQFMPHLIGRRWQDAVKEAAFGYRDDSFIHQFLSPAVVREFKMFSVKYGDENHDAGVVTEIQDERGFYNLRQALAESYERVNRVPQIRIIGADMENDRTLKLVYDSYKDRQVHEPDCAAVLGHLDYLWGYNVEMTLG